MLAEVYVHVDMRWREGDVWERVLAWGDVMIRLDPSFEPPDLHRRRYPTRGEEVDRRPRDVSASIGLVSSLDVSEEVRPSSPREGPLRLLQTDAAISPGNSGGPCSSCTPW